MNKKGIDTRAVNILVALIIITMLLAALHIWLKLETVTKQQSTMTGVAGTVEVDAIFAEILNSNSKLFHDAYAQKTDSKVMLERGIIARFQQAGYSGAGDCRKRESKLSCSAFGITKKGSSADVIQYKRFALLPTENGMLEVTIDALVKP